MSRKEVEIFYAKILLFGEYGIILDSRALSIPFTHFQGELSFDNRMNRYKYTDVEFAVNSNNRISEYVKDLESLLNKQTLNVEIDLDALKNDINKGLYFESSIPQGFGLGSSGALVASVYNRYAVNKITINKEISVKDLLTLKDIFSVMESYFHGKSSGIDPLNAYIKYPLLFYSAKEVETVEIPRKEFTKNTAIFLINSGQQGKTEPLVKLFLENSTKPEFNKKIRENYIPLSDLCIETLIKADLPEFFDHLTELSRFQIANFGEMIPASIKNTWEHGLDSGNFTMKLCGSGGGGYFLGFTGNFEATRTFLKEQEIGYITVYKGC
ncbi:MAG: hypothetical protein K8R53_11015 [Bacteroidales bacterium]|nr:hypothetical protein [Bacteroidales bacterium]